MRRAPYDSPDSPATMPEESEFSRIFTRGMLNRMLVSFHKYGPVESGIHKLDCPANARQRLALYEQDGNAEHLIDAANFLMMEFMYPKVLGAHFTGTDSDASPGRVLRDGRQSFGTNDENARPARSSLSRFRTNNDGLPPDGHTADPRS